MIVKWKYIRLLLLLLPFFLVACDSEMSDSKSMGNEQEQLVLRLNVKQRIRGANAGNRYAC